MEQDYNVQHEKIMNVVKCPKDLSCFKTKHIGSNTLLECLSENSQECVFSSFDMHKYFCKCPVRLHIVKNF